MADSLYIANLEKDSGKLLVSLGLLEDHLNHCVVGAAKASDEEGREKVAEATAAIARLWKS